MNLIQTHIRNQPKTSLLFSYNGTDIQEFGNNSTLQHLKHPFKMASAFQSQFIFWSDWSSKGIFATDLNQEPISSFEVTNYQKLKLPRTGTFHAVVVRWSILMLPHARLMIQPILVSVRLLLALSSGPATCKGPAFKFCSVQHSPMVQPLVKFKWSSHSNSPAVYNKHLQCPALR